MFFISFFHNLLNQSAFRGTREQKVTAGENQILFSENTQFTKQNTFCKLLYKHALSQSVKDQYLTKKETTDSIQLLGMDILNFLFSTNTFVLGL